MEDNFNPYGSQQEMNPPPNTFGDPVQRPEVESRDNEIQNERVKNLIKTEFPLVGIEFIDSKGVNGLHIGYLAEGKELLSQSSQEKISEFLYNSPFSYLDSKSAQFVRGIFSPQEPIDGGLVVSKLGISIPISFYPENRKDISDPEQYKTISLLEFDDETLEIFSDALNLLNKINKEEADAKVDPIDRIEKAFGSSKQRTY